MKSQAITVKIAGKSYPMTVDDANEEEIIRNAERIIKERLKMYEMRYAITDIRDLLGMCLLQFATEAIKNEKIVENIEQDVHNKLQMLEEALDLGVR